MIYTGSQNSGWQNAEMSKSGRRRWVLPRASAPLARRKNSFPHSLICTLHILLTEDYISLISITLTYEGLS